MVHCHYTLLCRNGGGDAATESYAETLATERRRLATINGTRLLINEGLLVAGSAVPHCAVMDALTGEYRPLTSRAGAHSGARPTAIFFWSPRSICSQKYLGWFVKFAKSNVSQVNIILTFGTYRLHYINLFYLFDENIVPTKCVEQALQ